MVHFMGALPAAWLVKLELRQEIEQVAQDLFFHFAAGAKLEIDDKEWKRYPGW